MKASTLVQVVVTGSAGKLGRATVSALKAAGHKVVRFVAPESPKPGSVPVDVTDLAAVMGALAGVDTMTMQPDAVVHLAAIPGPRWAPDHVVFTNNTMGTYNVLTAARTLKIDRVVIASSESVHGLPFTTPPAFLPVDESHPDRPEWSYSLSKQLGESMADAFVRWRPELSVVSLRLSNVISPDDFAMVRAIHADPGSRAMNLWGYVDATDAGEACRLAVEAQITGHERVLIAAADTLVDVPTAELQRSHFPDVPVRGELAGHTGLIDITRAEQVIGYRPRVSWRDWPLDESRD